MAYDLSSDLSLQVVLVLQPLPEYSYSTNPDPTDGSINVDGKGPREEQEPLYPTSRLYSN